MTLLDVVILALALLAVQFGHFPLLVTLVVALVVMAIVRVARGQRL